MRNKRKNFGFTTTELLTVMAIITLLLGILIPSLNHIRIMGKEMSQSAQLHAISVALDMFSGENEGYPESYVRPVDGSGYPGTSPYTIGAQHLAEALMGRDLLGFDPMTSWDAEWDNTSSNPLKKEIYASQTAKGSTPAQEADSLARRKGPYLSSQRVDAFEIGDLYADLTGNKVYNGAAASAAPAPILTDVFREKYVTLSNNQNVKAGSPILYYKANTSLTGANVYPLDTYTPADTAYVDFYGYIFNYVDNVDLINLGKMNSQGTKHHYDSAYSENSRNGIRLFYDAIENPKIVSQPRPYNKDTYLLISAGYDGLYGTDDDITNFGEK